MLCSSFFEMGLAAHQNPAGCNCIQPEKQMGECSAAQPQAVFVPERAAENYQQINEPSDAE